MSTTVTQLEPAQTHTAPQVEVATKSDDYKYARYLPHFDRTQSLQAPLTPFEHTDPGHKGLLAADPRAFLTSAKIDELTPEFGTEVEGVQLHKLSTEERQQLALFVAQRGVVVFRDQDFIDQPAEWLLNDWGSFWGRLHIHPTSASAANYPEFHLVYRDNEKVLNFEQLDERLTSSVWHSDVSYERQPPGLTTLFLFDSPPSGGDTGFADQRGAYSRLSPSFRSYLETLTVLHSGKEQAQDALDGNRGGLLKRAPVTHVHPLIRTHPVTGEKALYVNQGFSRKIIGLKIEESDAILKLLYDHVAQGADFQTRIRWKPRSVVLWDNRITAHTAIVDFAKGGGRRHGARITPQAEPPFFKA